MEIISRKDAMSAGLKRYFTGKPCKHSHLCERFVSSFGCVKCADTHEKTLCSKYPEYAARRQADRNERQSKRRKRNNKLSGYAEKVAEYMREYNANRRAHDPEYVKAKYNTSRKWFLENPEAARVYASKRRMKLRESESQYTRQDVLYLLKIQNNKCAEPTCKIVLNNNYHVDHIIPIALGGSNDRKNIQCLCPSCNVRKNAKHPLDWAREKGRLL